ncbi:hypothetical protein PWT90_02933 [Aphanocladium album]|nr:hypothetical protein PWT90_02933 [Aphanocladium album]
MTTMRAIVVVGNGRTAAIRTIPKPKPRAGWVLVRVRAVAVNPTDIKHVDFGGAEAGARVGCDFAGEVEEVGEGVASFTRGDRIAGLVHGCDKSNHENGAFGEYLVVKAGVAMRIPDNLSFEQAATLGVSLATGQGLYKSLKLPLPATPTTKSQFILINAASTATGLYGVQFARASGFAVVATCSPRNFALLRSLGAEAVFDYRSSTCAADIKAYTSNALTIAWDCMGTGAGVCAAAMSDTEEGDYGVINPADAGVLRATNDKVRGPHLTIAYEVFGEKWMWNGYVMEAKQDELAFAEEFFGQAREMLKEGIIKPIEPCVDKLGSGLEGVMRGLDELRAGRVSGTKLVYTLWRESV